MTRILIDRDGNPVHLQVVRPADAKVSPAPPRPEVGPLPPVARQPRTRAVVIDTPYGTFHGPTDDLITRQLAEFGAHTRNELAMVLSFVGEGDIVLDVGSHIGTFAVPLARKVGPNGRVFAFEPTAVSHDFLVRNVRENGVEGIVHVERLAAAESPQTLGVQGTEGNTGATALVGQGGGETVRAVTLDGWWRARSLGGKHRIALLKIDAEGMDCRVLQGARGILERDQPVIYFEFNPPALARAGSSVHELEELLTRHHYHCFTNLGPRNSGNDEFRLGRIRRARDVGDFGDVLAFHRASLRYPGYFAGPTASRWGLRARRVTELPRRALRRLRRAIARG